MSRVSHRISQVLSCVGARLFHVEVLETWGGSDLSNLLLVALVDEVLET